MVEELYASNNLVWRFVALRLWQEYQAVKDQPETREINDRLDQITYPVRISHEQQIKSWHMVYTYSDLYRFLGGAYFDFPAWVMYQAGRPMTVYHVTDFSILPLYVHYLKHGLHQAGILSILQTLWAAVCGPHSQGQRVLQRGMPQGPAEGQPEEV